MWLKLLRQWLEQREQIAEERRVEAHRVWQERREVELRKAQIDAWYWLPR
jgi:hypothetical protein